MARASRPCEISSAGKRPAALSRGSADAQSASKASSFACGPGACRCAGPRVRRRCARSRDDSRPRRCGADAATGRRPSERRSTASGPAIGAVRPKRRHRPRLAIRTPSVGSCADDRDHPGSGCCGGIIAAGRRFLPQGGGSGDAGRRSREPFAQAHGLHASGRPARACSSGQGRRDAPSLISELDDLAEIEPELPRGDQP